MFSLVQDLVTGAFCPRGQDFYFVSRFRDHVIGIYRIIMLMFEVCWDFFLNDPSQIDGSFMQFLQAVLAKHRLGPAYGLSEVPAMP